MVRGPAGQILISVINMTTTGNTRVMLLCSTEFAFPVMQELFFFQQLAVVAVPRKHKGFVENVQALLKDTNVPIVELDKDSFAGDLSSAIKQYDVNLGLIMTFGYLLPAIVYNLPAKGFFNVHPGPLPAYRGADPVFWQVYNREEQAGVSIHKLDDGYDTGPVVLTQMIKTKVSDSYGILNSRLAALATTMVRVLLKLAAFDLKIPLKPQPESNVYYARKTAKDVTINWQEMDADSIIALINACNPWNKGAVTKFNNRIIRILLAEKKTGISMAGKTPGSIEVLENKSVVVSTLNDEVLKLEIVYLEEGFLYASHLAEIGLVPGSCLT